MIDLDGIEQALNDDYREPANREEIRALIALARDANRLRAALESIVDSDLVYVGDEVVITCGSHNAARKLIADAREAIRLSDNETAQQVKP